MSVFGLTGAICSGKTTVLKAFQERGAVVFNVDDVVHKHLEDERSVIYQKVERYFPETIERGKVSFRKLRGVVFSDRQKLKQLEDIVHPIVIEELRQWVERERKREEVAVAEVPLLFEKKLEKLFDGIILVEAPQEKMIERMKAKYGISEKEALLRLKLFLPSVEKKKRSNFVINNDSNFFKLREEIDKIWEEIKGGSGNE